MNKNNKYKTIFLFSLLFTFFFLLKASFSSDLKLLSSDSDSLVYEFKAGKINSHNKDINGRVFQEISLENSGSTNIPGMPLLPVKSRLINIPDDKKLSFKIIETGENIYKNFYLIPSPEIITEENNGKVTISKRFTINNNVYSKNEFYPENIIKISREGFIREQKVAVLKIFPVQLNPVSREIRVYSKIKIKLFFEPDGQQANFKSVSSPATSFPFNIQSPTLKISIKEDGIYRITSNDLKQAGIDTSAIDPRNIRTFNKENELAILSVGESDGKFDDSDYIEFYGEKNNGEFTDANIYWLIIDDTQGKRMQASGTSPILSAPFETSFKALYHGEENLAYSQTIPKAEGKDHWFWHTFISGENTSQSFKIDFTLNNLKKKNGKTSLIVSLQGLTDITTNPADHHTQIFLNDTLVDEKRWDGFSEYSPNITILNSLLKNGNNTLNIKAISDKGVTIDGVDLNWFEVEYNKLLKAENNALAFSKAGNKI